MTRTQTAARIAKTLKRLSGATDAEIAQATGGALTRSNVNVKLNQATKGKAGWSLEDAEAFGRAFGVPSTVFLMDYEDAIRWVMEHQPDVQVDLTRLDLHSDGTRCFLPGREGLYNAMGQQARLFDDEGNIIEYETGDPSPRPAVIDLRDTAVTIPAPLQHEGAVAA